jgi:hypothetical protein
LPAASTSKGAPVPVVWPAALSAAARAALSRLPPMRRARVIAAGSVLRSWMALLRLVACSCWVAPDFQRRPTPRRVGSWVEGVMVTSPSRVRSRRLRSLSLVVGADHRLGRSATVAESCSGLGSCGRALVWVAGLGGRQLGESGLPAGFQAAGYQPVFRLAGVERAFGAFGLVAGAFDGEFGGAQ